MNTARVYGPAVDVPEADLEESEHYQQGFLVPRGSGVLVVEGEERPLRQWDYFHCPPGVAHAREACDGWERPTHARYDGWLD